MKCEYCKNDHENGSFYVFYYGKHISTLRVAHKTRKYNFAISGQQRAWICRACVLKRFAFSWAGLVTILFVLSLVSVLFEPILVWRIFKENPDFIGAMGLIVFGFIIMRHVMLNGLESLSLFGDELAIRAHRDKLQASGNNSFFTRAQYKQLSTSR